MLEKLVAEVKPHSLRQTLVWLKSFFARKLFWKCRSIKFISKDLKKTLKCINIFASEAKKTSEEAFIRYYMGIWSPQNLTNIKTVLYYFLHKIKLRVSPVSCFLLCHVYLRTELYYVIFFTQKKSLPVNFAPKIAWIATSCTIQGYFEHRALSYKLVIIMIPKRQPNPAKLHVFSYIFTPTFGYFYTDVSAIDGRSSLCQFFVFNHWRCADARK